MILALCMYGKMEESGLIEIIPLMCILAILGQNALFLHPESPQGMQSSGCSGWWLEDLQQSSTNRQHPSFTDTAGDAILFYIYLFGYVGVLAAARGIFAESCDLFCAAHGLSQLWSKGSRVEGLSSGGVQV